MPNRKPRRDQRDDSTLQFDVTQEIDPALAEQLLRSSEPTLTQIDFEDITIVLPKKQPTRS
jgi:hypothetical protein